MLDINLFRAGDTAWLARMLPRLFWLRHGKDCNLLSPWLCTDKGGDPEVVRESQRRRFADVAVVDQVIELDQEWKAGNTDCCAV